MTINLLISSVIQLLLLSLIPFLWWLAAGRKQIRSFPAWIGLVAPKVTQKGKIVAWAAVTGIVLSGLGLAMSVFILDAEVLASHQFHGLGMAGLVPVLLYSFLQTSLSEEIFFRGFLGKRLIAGFGFAFGNTVQAALFGLLHAVMLFQSTALPAVIAVFLLTGLVGWSMGYINERLSGGSIAYSWLLHGLLNLVSGLYMLFA